jgi:hypothetical protein
MAVRDPETVDTIARSADGVVLAMTEDRPYTPETTPTLVEELRVKLNTYIYAVKSGQIHERRPGEPGVVLLYTVSQPPEEVLEVLRFAGHVLAEDGVTVDWKMLDAAARSYTDVLREIAGGLMQAVPSNWMSLSYGATIVGEHRRDVLEVETPEGRVTLPGAPDHVRALLEELKRLMWEPERGTWLGAELGIDRSTQQLSPSFNYNLEPFGGPLPAEAYLAELRTYPRPPESVPDWMAALIGEQR